MEYNQGKGKTEPRRLEGPKKDPSIFSLQFEDYEALTMFESGEILWRLMQKCANSQSGS